MIKIEVNEEYNSSIESVWEKIIDHESYKNYAPIKDSILTKFGIEEKNGLGAIRKIIPNDSLYFLEKITKFDKYSRFDYLIFESSLPLKHYGGSVTLEKTDLGTKVFWTSDFDMPENTSPAIQRGTKSASAKMFKEILAGIKQQLESVT
ncbi:MAG: SRPBCC family protein [Leptospiraceae bacterium]|nr:SRPBCC family protein [Leptospiraceae bacterium]MCP5494131.1 SRPBCC family protein [Leptospiraceae bacterium]